MTAFVLVAGPWTGDRVWREVSARLREQGAEVYPAPLTGTDGAGAGPGTDLETHIGDLLRLIDRVDAPEMVLVGHGMGIHPVLGAADRRPERIGRIVSIEGPLPRDGESVLDLLPDTALRDLVRDRAEDGWRVPPPPAEEWPLWGSTAGVPADALAELVRLAVPQPLGTLDRPLRLSGAAGGIATTGVLCTANGSSVSMVEAALATGEPRFQDLAHPRVRFLEIATGYWPMLSAPGELADVLLRAAAGEGRRPAQRTGEPPAHLGPFLLDVPARPRVRSGRADLWLPDADGPRPAVVFVHGGPVPSGPPTPRDWPVFAGYGRYVAEHGAVGAVVDHRLHGVGDFARAAGDVAEAVAAVRADPRVDGERVALWYFSGGGLLSADRLAEPAPWLRCVALSYPLLAPPPGWRLTDARFRPAEAVRGAGRLPIVLTRVGRERPEFAATVEEFLEAAADCGANVEVVDLPLGRHGFEATDRTEPARRAVRRAVRSVLGHLRD